MKALGKLVSDVDNEIRADVEIGKTTRHHLTGEFYRAEVNIHIGKKILHAEELGRNLNSAIDLMQEEIAKELRRHIDRQTSLVRKGGRDLKERVRDSRA